MNKRTWFWLGGGGGLALVTGLMTLILSVTHSCACGIEAKDFVGAIARGQQAHYLEFGRFSGAIEPLNLGMPSETKRNRYVFEVTAHQALVYAQPKQKHLSAYVSGVFLLNSQGEMKDIVCAADRPGSQEISPPTLVNSQPTCGQGSHAI
ncbi:MAG: type IV pilin-like G/H family protein [Cyanobacteria bacterium P01_G01_bin.54]